MQNSKTIFVTGATGNQGGAVARQLSAKGFHVRALCRNTVSPAAQELKKLNVELVTGDLDEPSSYRNFLQDADGVFSLQIFSKGIEKEKKQGIALASLSKESGVKHFLYSSVIGADANTGIPHWESKNVIEQHIKQSGLSYTILRPSSFFENFLLPPVKSRILKGKLVTPTAKNKVQQFISASDVGRISTMIFMDPEKYRGRTINIGAEQMDMQHVAAIFSKVMGKEIKYQQLPGLITRLVMGSDLSKMFKWINHNDALFIKDLDTLKKEFPGMLSLEDWIRKNFNS